MKNEILMIEATVKALGFISSYNKEKIQEKIEASEFPVSAKSKTIASTGGAKVLTNTDDATAE